jgi:hypothetical protein
MKGPKPSRTLALQISQLPNLDLHFPTRNFLGETIIFKSFCNSSPLKKKKNYHLRSKKNGYNLRRRKMDIVKAQIGH